MKSSPCCVVRCELELELLNGRGAGVASEQALQATWRRLAAHPLAARPGTTL